MSTTTQAPATWKKYLPGVWFVVAHLAMIGVLLIPNNSETLTWHGQIALAVLVFAIIMWVTEAVTYTVSSLLIVVYVALLLGLAPSLEEAGEAVGTSSALSTAMSGFSGSAVVLVAAALMLAAAMQVTGLHKRIALYVLKFAGEKTSNVVAGTIVISIVLAFFVPSATARAGAIVPILLGMVAAFGMAKGSNLAALLIITAAQSISVWNIGIKTAAAQNMVAIGFIEESMGITVSWGQWFIWAAPWAVIMSVVLYFVMTRAIKPEVERIEGGREQMKSNWLSSDQSPAVRRSSSSFRCCCFWHGVPKAFCTQ